MDAILYYCQSCDAEITLEQLVTLEEGKCSVCDSNLGFSTQKKEINDSFNSDAVVLNDTDFLQQ